MKDKKELIKKSIPLMLRSKKIGSPESINYIAENGITPEMLEGPKKRK